MLTLPIKKEWFSLIRSGTKQEEYREIKPYYRARFINYGLLDSHGLPTLLERQIVLRNGYSASSPEMVIRVGLDIREGKPEWGAEQGKEYYVLVIKEVIA